MALSNGYWYMEGADGRHFCFAKEPTYTCPHAHFERTRVDEETVERIPTPAVKRAAEALGADPELLARGLERQHASFTYGRRRVNGKLTDQCAVCGARMQRKGFRCWIEREPTDDERNDMNSRVAGRLGFSNMRTERSFYVDTKREAREWAAEEVKVTRAAMAERP